MKSGALRVTFVFLALIARTASAQDELCEADAGGTRPACEGPLKTDYSLRWRPPEGEVTGYRAYVGTASMSYADPIELGVPAALTDGTLAASIEGLDTAGDSYVSLTAQGPGGESILSNEIVIPATRCSEACTPAHGCAELICAGDECQFANAPDGKACGEGNTGRCAAGRCEDTRPSCPAGEPRAVHLGWSSNPARSMRLQWRGPRREPGRLRVRALGETGWTTHEVIGAPLGACDARYKLELGDLAPLTYYEYQIESESAQGPRWGSSGRFSTAPLAGDRRGPGLRVVFLASVGTPGAAHSPEADRVIEAAAALEPDAVLGGGGYAYSAERRAAARPAVERWFAKLAPLLGRTPFLPVFAETESSARGENPRLYADVHGGFPQAAAAPGHYTFTLGTTYYVALQAPRPAQLDEALLAWLDAALASPAARAARHRVVYMHSDLFDSRAELDDRVPRLRARFADTLTQRGVNLALSGDAPGLELSHPLRGEQPQPQEPPDEVDAGAGVVYLRAGSGGREDHIGWVPYSAPGWLHLRESERMSFVLLHEKEDGRLGVRILALPDGEGEPIVRHGFTLN
jgi:hypothetical protein